MTNRKILCMIVCLLTTVFSLQAQYFNNQSNFLKANSVWTFGEGAGLDFNGDRPLAIQTPGFYAEAAASVCDPTTGALLFYTDGANCYNRNNQVMPNGDNLMSTMYPSVGKQGLCIVPMVDTPGKYYLFALETLIVGGGWMGGGLLCNQLTYSIVDMSLDQDRGDVVPGRKSVVLDSLLTGSVIAIPGEACDYWIVVHSTSDPDVVADPFFKAYHITAAGLNPVPVVSTIKSGITTPSSVSFPTLPDPQAYLHTWMAVSPNREMLAMGVWNGDWGALYPDGMAGPIFNDILPVDVSNPNPGGAMEVHAAGLLGYKFNAATGVVSNELFIRNYGAVASVCFSPDNTKLYANLQGPVNGGLLASDGSTITQYEVNVWDSAKVVTSKTDIYRTPGVQEEDPIDLRLYNDTIYFSKYYRAGVLGRINNPNLKGAACGFQDTAIILKQNTFAYSYFPNQVVYPYMHPDTVHHITDSLICHSFESITLESKGSGKNFVWDDGSLAASRSVSTRGKYWVTYNEGCTIVADTFIISGADMDAEIAIDVFELRTTKTYASYQWLLNGNIISGATAQTYTVNENGSYTVVVTEGACTDTSAAYPVTNVTGINDPGKWGTQISIYPNPALESVHIAAPIPVTVTICSMEGKVIATEVNVRHIAVKELAAGMYLLQIRDDKGALLKIEKLIKVDR